MTEEQLKVVLKKNDERLNAINEEIFRKKISLEYFWRTVMHYIKPENTNVEKYTKQNVKTRFNAQIERLMNNGEAFELIDGENLEFKGQIIQDTLQQAANDNVIVVAVIGPQSTGKSTLMNYAFGTQFFTATGRCTSGIYFTLQRFPDQYSNNKAKVKWLLMLDTEGLQSAERKDAEYDRKIVLFAMLNADLLIINNKGEINTEMKRTL